MKHWITTSLLTGVAICTSAWAAETEINSLADAFQQGTTKATVGTYFEAKSKDADDKDTAWGTGYLYLKHETAAWNRLQFGASFLSHNQLFSERDSGVGSDPCHKDIEEELSMPELYVKALILENSSLVVGRFNHKKISHIDDAQSEGAYFQYKESEHFEAVAGIMTKFAELDYDDGEDFGRSNGKQDLSTDPDTGDYLLFLEAKADLGEHVKVNPYIMHQADVATVTGMDTDWSLPSEDGLGFGARFDFYNVFAAEDGCKDSFDWAFAPYVTSGPFTLTAGVAQFGADTETEECMNKPGWMKDYLVGVLDQDCTYGNSNTSVVFGKLGAKFGDFSTHLAVGHYTYDLNEDQGDASTEIELQGTYKITKNLDINLRLFDVSFDNVEGEDYQKVEGRMRYRF